tara:strand:- start:1064 stop:2584 length:1521 start_codon:yes stop_codon:yes gene_type:complete
MGGSLMQLVFIGKQDVYLTGNPQITFFKSIHKRYTNFSMESILLNFIGTINFGRKINCTISKSGDLIHKMYLVIELPEIDCETSEVNKFRWVNWLGHVLIKSVSIEIGGQKIDEHYGEWLHIWNELSQKEGKKTGYATLVGNTPRLTQIVQGNLNNNNSNKIPANKLYIPLQFWFCKNPGLALPIIALGNNDIKISVELREHQYCYWATGKYKDNPPEIINATLHVDYINLDVDERRTFSQTSHDYLIEQLQFNGQEIINTQTNKIKLNFNHPIKELIWIVQPISNVDLSYTENIGGPQHFNYTDNIDKTYFSGTPNHPYGGGMSGNHTNNISWGLPVSNNGANVNINGNTLITPLSGQNNNLQLTNNNFYDITTPSINTDPATSTSYNLNLFDKGNSPVTEAKIQMNGQDRITYKDFNYFNIIQPFQHHTNIPAIGINLYSFSLYPEDFQPSGSCNYSVIDSSYLLFKITNESITDQRKCYIRIYATNYNILNIATGIGRLSYNK